MSGHPFNDMNKHKEAVACLRKLLLWLETNPPPQQCLNCDHFAQANRNCRSYDRTVPENYNGESCPSWRAALPF